ncbi:hypothetical protein VKT23_020421 [Stygiomarasmius scandens]|uniref:Uncharacterized protein n=1 Tax=Marasmiellus scandens TaxID=2682957 RepID=A0ABR1IMJ0_9AGAR
MQESSTVSPSPPEVNYHNYCDHSPSQHCLYVLQRSQPVPPLSERLWPSGAVSADEREREGFILHLMPSYLAARRDQELGKFLSSVLDYWLDWFPSDVLFGSPRAILRRYGGDVLKVEQAIRENMQEGREQLRPHILRALKLSAYQGKIRQTFYSWEFELEMAVGHYDKCNAIKLRSSCVPPRTSEEHLRDLVRIAYEILDDMKADIPPAVPVRPERQYVSFTDFRPNSFFQFYWTWLRA